MRFLSLRNSFNDLFIGKFKMKSKFNNKIFKDEYFF